MPIQEWGDYTPINALKKNPNVLGNFLINIT